MTHICVGKLTIIGSDKGLSPVRHQAIIWTNAGLLLIRHTGTNFSEILIEIQTFFIQENAFENVVCEMASICLGLNMLRTKLCIWCFTNYVGLRVMTRPSMITFQCQQAELKVIASKTVSIS